MAPGLEVVREKQVLRSAAGHRPWARHPTRPMTTRGDTPLQLAPSTHPQVDVLMAPAPLHGSRADGGRQSLAPTALGPRARSENSRRIERLPAVGPRHRGAQATTIWRRPSRQPTVTLTRNWRPPPIRGINASMAPEPIRGCRANRGRQSVARLAVDPRSRTENNGGIYRLPASAQVGDGGRQRQLASAGHTKLGGPSC